MLYVVGNRAWASSHSFLNHRFSVWMVLFIIGLTAGSSPSYASDTTRNKLHELRRNAVRYENKGDPYRAILCYDSCVRLDSKDIKSLYRMASLYFAIRNYEKAHETYSVVIEKAPDDYKMAYYYDGIVRLNLEDYAGAKDRFAMFRKVYRNKRDPHKYRRLASSFVESADWALAHPEINKSIVIQHLGPGINGSHIEFSPFPVTDNKILYGALVWDTLKPGYGVRQLYTAEKENGKWSKQKLLEGPVNDPSLNTGNAVVSEDGQRMYFTRSRKNWQNEEISEIFISYNRQGSWQQPQKLPYPINIENSTSTQPALGKNLRTGKDILYFVSDRPGTRGGLDIWYTEAADSAIDFREPKNLGRNINSPGNECCPFYDGMTRTLYFSSSARDGYGGYDFYSTTGSATHWTPAVNIGKPYNTSYDDMYFSILKNGHEGFFTSNRPGTYSLENGGCCDDIYYYYTDECTRINSRGIVINNSNHDRIDLLNEKYHLNLEYPEDSVRLPDIPVSLYRIDSDTGTGMLIAQTRTDENGIYSFELEKEKKYLVLVKNYGYFDKRITVSTVNRECNEPLIIAVTGINYIPPITVRLNVYYEHDKYRLTPEAETAIDTSLIPLIELFPNAIVEIGSHTDSTGTDEYNIKLSQRRSESVIRYLVGKGIQEAKLQARGYGERFPIAPNSNPDGSDNPAGRQLNRRTELKIIGEINLFYEDE
jgi:outer membrane protein OmpA-like peptidoglycan-associated protein/tetratricopeptide (TPR) repeat protein